MKKHTLCYNMNITISFMTMYYKDLSDDIMKTKISYLINYTPYRRDYYIDDANSQGGFMKDYSFKQIQLKTLEDVCEELKIIFLKAKEDGITVRILDGAISNEHHSEHKQEFTGMLHYNGNCFNRNRQLNDDEISYILDYLLKHVPYGI